MAIMIGGCVTSRQADYERQLTALVAPGAVADDEVAEAFGLDGHAIRVAGLERGDVTGN